jgi:hypothetical protein
MVIRACFVAALVALSACGKDDGDANGPAGDSPLDEPGRCAAQCVEPRDCCNTQPGAMNCFNNFGSFPYRFECHAGVCELLGCTSDAECEGLVEQPAVCADFSGFGACVTTCSTDEDCNDGQRCVEESGVLFCRNYCEADSDCTDISHCVDGRCVYDGCSSDGDCSLFNGGTCQPDGTCSCRTNAECSEDFACAPV